MEYAVNCDSLQCAHISMYLLPRPGPYIVRSEILGNTLRCVNHLSCKIKITKISGTRHQKHYHQSCTNSDNSDQHMRPFVQFMALDLFRKIVLILANTCSAERMRKPVCAHIKAFSERPCPRIPFTMSLSIYFV